MKVLTSHLIDKALDWAVADIEGTVFPPVGDWTPQLPPYLALQSAEIADRERINSSFCGTDEKPLWLAQKQGCTATGQSLAIATLRCHVKAWRGDVVTVPDEFLHDPVAAEFLRQLQQAVGTENYAQICALNLAQSDRRICHSHDFTDANMVMDAAISAVTGMEVDIQDDAQRHLWNTSWDLARDAMDQAAIPSPSPSPGS